MSKRNNYWILAGLLNLSTAAYYSFASNEDLMAPLLASSILRNQTTAEIYGIIVVVGVLFFLTSFFLLKKGFTKKEGPRNIEGPMVIGVIYSVIALSYTGIMEMMREFILLPVLLIPTIIFIFVGIYKEMKTPIPTKVVVEDWQL